MISYLHAVIAWPFTNIFTGLNKPVTSTETKELKNEKSKTNLRSTQAKIINVVHMVVGQTIQKERMINKQNAGQTHVAHYPPLSNPPSNAEYFAAP